MASSVPNSTMSSRKCIGCLEMCPHPRILVCLHAICFKCQRELTRRNRVRCPDCKKYTNTSDIKHDLKRSAEGSTINDADDICSVCEGLQKPDCSSCETCTQELCADCLDSHMNGSLTKRHKIKAMEESHAQKSVDRGTPENKTRKFDKCKQKDCKDSVHETDCKHTATATDRSRANDMVSKEIHQAYHHVKCVSIEQCPTKLCLYQDQLWVATGAKGIIVYNLDLEKMNQICHTQFKNVTGLLHTSSGDVIVSDAESGLHQLNSQGDYIRPISPGRFSDISSCSNDVLYTLEHGKGVVCSFTKTCDNSWVEGNQFRLHYKTVVWLDKLCAFGGCLYVSSVYSHCVYIYSLSGEFQKSAGELGVYTTRAFEAGKLRCPMISDVDRQCNLLVCDNDKNRLQVFNWETSEWRVITLPEGMLKMPMSAVVGDGYLWVGAGSILTQYKLLKFEKTNS